MGSTFLSQTLLLGPEACKATEQIFLVKKALRSPPQSYQPHSAVGQEFSVFIFVAVVLEDDVSDFSILKGSLSWNLTFQFLK